MSWKIDVNYWIEHAKAFNQPTTIPPDSLKNVINYDYEILDNPNHPPSMNIYAYRIGILRHGNVIGVHNITQLGIRNVSKYIYGTITELAPKVALIAGSISRRNDGDQTKEVSTNDRLIHFGTPLAKTESTPWLHVDHQLQIAKVKIFNTMSTAIVFPVRKTPEGWYPEYYQDYAVLEHPRHMAALVVHLNSEPQFWIGQNYQGKFSGKMPNIDDLSEIYPYLATHMARKHKTSSKNFFERMAFNAL